MRATTAERYRHIRREFYQLLGTMPLMQIYIVLAEQFHLSDETIRQIVHKKPP